MPSDSTDQVPVPSNDWIGEHYPRIHRAAWVMTGNVWEAEDLAQDTFVVALDRWEKFERRSSESTWLFGILIRLNQRRKRSLMRLRRRLQVHFDRHRHEQESLDPQHLLSQQQWRDSVWAEVAKLPKPQCDAVTLRYAEGLSYDEIAAIVGCPAGTAKTRVHHGIKRLQSNEELQPETERNLSVVGPAVNVASRSS